jgi:hypothetical protein
VVRFGGDAGIYRTSRDFHPIVGGPPFRIGRWAGSGQLLAVKLYAVDSGLVVKPNNLNPG